MARYRFRATFRGRLGGYVALVLLIGMLGGLALAALAGARRTQSSYPALLRASNSSDLGLAVSAFDPSTGSSGYNAELVDRIRHLPHVKHVEAWAALNVVPLQANGKLDPRMNVQAGGGSGSVDGLYFDQDRATAIEGRLANPNRADEFEVNAAAAKQAGLHVGDVLHLGVYTNEQTTSPAFGTNALAPYRRIAVKLTGIVAFDEDAVRDDIDATGDVTVQFTPALTHELVGCCAPLAGVAIQLDHGSRDVPAVEAEIQKIAPPGQVPQFTVTALVAQKAERAIKPESIALAVFGVIVALATLLIAGQVIGRQLRLDADDLEVLRALGAGPATTTADGLPGTIGAIVAGAVVAFGTAIVLSPLAPLGPVRSIDPNSGVDVDWAVLGIGALVIVALLSADRVRHRASARTPSRRAAWAVRTARVASRAHGSTSEPVAGGGDRHPLRARDRRGPRSGTGAIRDRERGACDRRRGRDRDLRCEPRHVGVTAVALRLELDL